MSETISVSDEVLLEFVAHSNRIEGEPDEPGHPLFDDHFATAQFVRAKAVGRGKIGEGPFTAPSVIHQRLMASQPGKWPGEYRQSRVGIRRLDGGIDEKMPPVDVRPAMPALHHRAGQSAHFAFRKIPCPTEDELWNLHHEFERIHPFVDGNGRTGRLFLNALRLVCGYDWLTVRYEDREAYYQMIIDYEDRVARLPEGEEASDDS